jgi:hypothetical protein
LSYLASHLSGLLSNLAHRLPSVLPEPLRYLPDLLAHLACNLPKTLSDLPNPLTKPLAKLADTLAETLPELPDSLAKTLPELADALPKLSDRAAGPERLARRASRSERLLAELANVSDSIANGVNEAFENLGVAVECRQGAIEDVVEVLQAHLQQRLRLDARDVDLDLAEMHMHAGHHVNEVRELRAQREVRFELFDVDIDLVDLELADVDEDVGLVRRFASLEPLAAQFLCGRGTRNHVMPLAL